MGTQISASWCWLDTFLNNKCPAAFLPLRVERLALHAADTGSQAQTALIKHQETRWGQIRGQTVDLKVTELNVLFCVYAARSLRGETRMPPQRRTVTAHAWVSCVGMFVRAFYPHTQTETRPGGMLDRRLAGRAWLWCRVAVGVPGCDPAISVFVLCHSPSPLGRWQSSSAWGDETWARQSSVVNNNSFMRRRRLPAAFRDLRERQKPP